MNSTAALRGGSKPWYREPWPWLLMAGPFLVIVASLVSAWIAIRSSDGLVTEDYYSQGQAAGETLARSRHAEVLGLQAVIRMTENGMRIRLTANKADFQHPPAIRMTLSHPTRAGIDQQVRFDFDGQSYSGMLRLPASGNWLLLIEDEQKSWRLMGGVRLPAAGELLIGGEDAGKPKS